MTIEKKTNRLSRLMTAVHELELCVCALGIEQTVAAAAFLSFNLKSRFFVFIALQCAFSHDVLLEIC